jgi:hypothetical protein
MALPRRCAASLRLAARSFLRFAVYDRRVEDPGENGALVGKSETCHASAWPSHRLNSIRLDLDFGIFLVADMRSSAWPSPGSRGLRLDLKVGLSFKSRRVSA